MYPLRYNINLFNWYERDFLCKTNFNQRLEFYRPDETAYYLAKWTDNYYVKELHKSVLGITLWLVRKDK